MGGLIQCRGFQCPSGTQCQDTENNSSSCAEISKEPRRELKRLPSCWRKQRQDKKVPRPLPGPGSSGAKGITWWEGILETVARLCPSQCQSLCGHVTVHFCCWDTMCCDTKQLGDKGLLLAHSSSPSLWGLRELTTGTQTKGSASMPDHSHLASFLYSIQPRAKPRKFCYPQWPEFPISINVVQTVPV